jgi:hypothetical protein
MKLAIKHKIKKETIDLFLVSLLSFLAPPYVKDWIQIWELDSNACMQGSQESSFI